MLAEDAIKAAVHDFKKKKTLPENSENNGIKH
jgi:hypothetical protein